MQALALVAGVYLLLASIALGRRQRDYSHLRNTLSELGERGAPHAQLASWALFAPVGCALAVVGCYASQVDLAYAQLSFCLSVGYLGAALFPCDRGAPVSGSWRQNLHSAAGAIEYFGGVLALLQLSARRDGAAYLVAAIVVSAATICASLPTCAPVRGAAQRVAELVLFSALILGAGSRDTQ